MTWLLFLIPVLAMASALGIYPKNGKREFLKFDVVQFFYAFILSPVLFIWIKSFLFFILRQELGLNLSLTGIFIWDTVFSVSFLFVYAFIVIHSLTKSFENKRYIDPLYDVFKHSETMHLWVSHTAIYFGAMALVSLLSIANIFFPVPWELNQLQFYSVLVFGFSIGGIGFSAIWLSVFESKFLRVNKLLFGFFFLLHVIIYFWFDPTFKSTHMLYWMFFSAFTSLVLLSLFFERSERAVSLVEKLSNKLGWSAAAKRYMLSK